MAGHLGRRRFLQSSLAVGTLAGLGDLAFLSNLRPVSAQEAALEAAAVRLDPSVEPLVRLLEETPRDELLEVVASRVRQGLSYRDLLAALLLAGVRNIQPRPSVGFKFHAVLVVNSAHLASLSAPDSDRWLPIFWALDEFKSSQARDVREGNWTMAPVAEGSLPAAADAGAAFERAMQRWDVPAADVSVAALARAAGSNELFEMFARFGVRDFRSIGHKAIYVANSWRTLHCIGWHHAEPVLRSLAYALLNHEGEPNPADSDLAADRAGRRNEKLAEEIRADWRSGELREAATEELLVALRTASADEACDLVVRQLNEGVSPQSVYDALFLQAGELLMRQPGIVALHAVTSTNAMNYIYRAAADDHTRRLVLLQNTAFLPLFREAMKGRGNVGDARVNELEPATPRGDDALADIFEDVSGNPHRAAAKVLAFLGQQPPEPLIDAARRLIFLKGNDSHDYKFSSAVLEDYYHVSPAYRDRFLASSVFKLRGSAGPDNRLVARTRAALRA